MNTLHQLPSIIRRRAKRVGRGLGSGKGAKSGRGTTRHQAALESMPLHFEGGQGRFIKKFPLLRGKGKNNSHQLITRPLAVDVLNIFEDNTEVSTKTLADKKLIDSVLIRVKIVGGAKLTKKLTVQLPVSQSAKKAIEAAGGTVTVS